MTLYDITKDFMVLMEMMEDPEADPQAIQDSMESLDYMLEDKADGYAKVIAELAAKSDALKEHAERLDTRRKTIDGNIRRMKENLQQAMTAAGREKFKTELFSFGIQNNPPALVIDNEEEVAEEYLLPQPPKVDRKKILDDLKAGKEICWAHTEQGRSLRIR